MTIKLYHPELPPTEVDPSTGLRGNECEVQNEDQAAILAESGWKPAPEPEAREGYQPEPVEYAPVESKPAKRVSKSTKSDSDTD